MKNGRFVLSLQCSNGDPHEGSTANYEAASAAEAKQQAVAAGWKLQSIIDLCPTCTKAIAERKATSKQPKLSPEDQQILQEQNVVAVGTDGEPLVGADNVV